MRFKTVEIKPNDHEWYTYISDLELERENIDNGPNGWGFYHFPITKSDQQAFQELKSMMMERHKIEIKSLQESLSKLEKLQLGDK